MNLIVRLFFTLTLLTLAACSSAKNFAPVSAGPTPKVLVLLQADTPADMARERADYIQQALLSELKSAGFYVLDPALANNQCGGADCPNREQLAKAFGAEAFLQLKLDSVSRNNFVAGYYNVVSGTVSVSNREKKELFGFKHSQSEKGGLLFNTGQIFQGIKSQFENSNANSFEALADKFVKGLVARIPEPEKEQSPESDLRISKTSIKQTRKGVYNICAEANPGALAYLILGREKPNLREVKSGLYCANLSLGPVELQDQIPQVEVRSALGGSVRSELSGFKFQPLCDLDGIVQVAGGQPETKLFFQCENSSEECQQKLQRCMGNSYIVYRSPNALGPYTKVAKFETREWIDRMPPGKDSNYVLVATNADGFRSKPVSAEKINIGKS